jgi:hypothetical protein
MEAPFPMQLVGYQQEKELVNKKLPLCGMNWVA